MIGIRNGVEYVMTPEEEAEFEASRALPPPTEQQYQHAIQSLVDDTARAKQFNDGVTLASYKDSTNPVWASQAAAFIAWRDQVWGYAYEQLSLVQRGGRNQPSVSDFVAELPAITWPE